jgi:putative (di)nucleoside polyphosphate hydrolase
MAMENHDYFRASVGAVVQNHRGEVLVLERSDQPGAWQLPQGGIRKNEEPEAAVLRELREETGLSPDRVQIVEVYPEWLAYELPAPAQNQRLGRGQVQRWFWLRLACDPASETIDLAAASSGEFRAWRWMPLSRIAEETVAFRRHIYRKLAARWSA